MTTMMTTKEGGGWAGYSSCLFTYECWESLDVTEMRLWCEAYEDLYSGSGDSGSYDREFYQQGRCDPTLYDERCDIAGTPEEGWFYIEFEGSGLVGYTVSDYGLSETCDSLGGVFTELEEE